MPAWVALILDRGGVALLARLLLTLPFWAEGFRRLLDLTASNDELRSYGLAPAGPINALVIFTLLGSSLLVIANRRAWSGAGALAILTLMTIPVAHDFWNLRGHAARRRLITAIARRRRRRTGSTRP